jgi:hypothetical protein
LGACGTAVLRDWVTSKAYFIGLAFVAVGFSTFSHLFAVCALAGFVGHNSIIV